MTRFLLMVVVLSSLSWAQASASVASERDGEEGSARKTGHLTIHVSSPLPGAYSPRPEGSEGFEFTRAGVLRQQAIETGQAPGGGVTPSQGAGGERRPSLSHIEGDAPALLGAEYNSGIPPVAPRLQTLMGTGDDHKAPPVVVVVPPQPVAAPLSVVKHPPAQKSWFRRWCCCCCRCCE